MRHLAIIAFIAGLTVFAGSLTAEEEGAAAPDSAVAAAVDTLTHPVNNNMADNRDSIYNVRRIDPDARVNPTVLTETDIFRADAAGVSEIMRYRALTSVSIPFSLSSSLNRVLPYGNVHPPNFLTTGFTPLPSTPFPYGAARYWSGGMISPAQAAGFSIDPYHGFLYQPYPSELTKPEFVIFWENGVFNQNTLSLRLTRPLSSNIMINLFSNYRYFQGKQFNHEQNDVAGFYEFFYSDTSRMVNHGYNPLVDEHVLGGSILRTGADSSKIYAAFTYAGLINEYALNVATPLSDPRRWGTIDRGIYRIDAVMAEKKLGTAQIDVRTAFASEALAVTSPSITPIPIPAAAITDSSQSYSFIADASLTLSSGLGFILGSMIGNAEYPDGTEQSFYEYHAEIFYNRRLHSLSTPNWLANLHLRGGAAINPSYGAVIIFPDRHDNDILVSPKIGAAIEYESKKCDVTRGNLYINLDHILTLGAEGQKQWRHWGLLLGYQAATPRPPDFAWLEETSPYQQPASTFIIAPWTSRMGGFALMSKSFVTDTKPHLKTSTSLSHIFKPSGMSHTFETELGFDYWSERDPVTFAGHYGWGEPIYDLNLKITAHIKSFRLFYKADNLLNMRYAYVPGYFSPGLTFRWGLNWFIQ